MLNLLWSLSIWSVYLWYSFMMCQDNCGVQTVPDPFSSFYSMTKRKKVFWPCETLTIPTYSWLNLQKVTSPHGHKIQPFIWTFQKISQILPCKVQYIKSRCIDKEPLLVLWIIPYCLQYSLLYICFKKDPCFKLCTFPEIRSRCSHQHSTTRILR